MTQCMGKLVLIIVFLVPVLTVSAADITKRNACQMTVDLFGYKPEDFIVEVKEYCGAAHFLPMARDADVSVFI